MGKCELTSESMILGARIAEARRRAGLSQAALAARLGVHETAVYKIEHGRLGVGKHVRAIHDLLGIPLEDFFPPKGDPQC